MFIEWMIASYFESDYNDERQTRWEGSELLMKILGKSHRKFKIVISISIFKSKETFESVVWE